MKIIPAGVKLHLVLGITDMRKGLDGLAALVQVHSLRLRHRPPRPTIITRLSMLQASGAAAFSAAA